MFTRRLSGTSSGHLDSADEPDPVTPFDADADERPPLFPVFAAPVEPTPWRMHANAATHHIMGSAHIRCGQICSRMYVRTPAGELAIAHRHTPRSDDDDANDDRRVEILDQIARICEYRGTYSNAYSSLPGASVRMRLDAVFSGDSAATVCFDQASLASVSLHQWGARRIGSAWCAYTDDPAALSPWLHNHIVAAQRAAVVAFVDGDSLNCRRDNMTTIARAPLASLDDAQRVSVMVTSRSTGAAGIPGVWNEKPNRSNPHGRVQLRYYVGGVQKRKSRKIDGPLGADRARAMDLIMAQRDALMIVRESHQDAHAQTAWCPEVSVAPGDAPFDAGLVDGDAGSTRTPEWVMAQRLVGLDGRRIGCRLAGRVHQLCEAQFCFRYGDRFADCEHYATQAEADAAQLRYNARTSRSENAWANGEMTLIGSRGAPSVMLFDAMNPIVIAALVRYAWRLDTTGTRVVNCVTPGPWPDAAALIAYTILRDAGLARDIVSFRRNFRVESTTPPAAIDRSCNDVDLRAATIIITLVFSIKDYTACASDPTMPDAAVFRQMTTGTMWYAIDSPDASCRFMVSATKSKASRAYAACALRDAADAAFWQRPPMDLRAFVTNYRPNDGFVFARGRRAAKRTREAQATEGSITDSDDATDDESMRY